MTETVVNFLATITLLSNVLIVLILLKWQWAKKILTRKAREFALLVAGVATFGSLFLSEVALFTPCKLCWFQRIFMYPLVIILAVSIWKKRNDVFYYVLPLSVIGSLIAAYHYYLQVNPEQIGPCSTVGFSVSCSERFFTYYNYITIPWMALSAFVLISLAMLALQKK